MYIHMSDYTICCNTQSEVVINKSRFICSLCKTETESLALEFIRFKRKEHWNATHNCSAYIIDSTVQRSNDDGEPGGTAGIPMLEVLRKAQVCGVTAVVTRYFGGTKLGAGGLIRAYTRSVALAIEKSGLVERVEVGEYIFQTDLVHAGRIVNMLYADGRYDVLGVEYGNSVRILFAVRRTEYEEAEKYLTELLGLPVDLCYIGSKVVEVPVKNKEL